MKSMKNYLIVIHPIIMFDKMSFDLILNFIENNKNGFNNNLCSY